jgi:flagellar hook-associated protein 3 FlgL
MLSRQVEMHDTQEQIASGLKLRKPSDNPADMASVLDFQASISINTRYQKNISAVQLRLNTEDSALDSATNILYRARELALTGINASYNNSDREALGRELHEMTRALMDLANTRTDSGDYIFAGSKSDTKPFDFDSKSPGPVITYRGDQYQSRIQVGSGIYIETSHSGFSIFENVPSADESLVMPDAAGSEAAVTVDTTDDAATDADVAAVAVDGLPTDDTGTSTVTDATDESATGDPAASATASAPRTRSIFNTLLKLEGALTGNWSDSEVTAIVTTALQDIDAGMQSISNVRVDIGARLSMLDQQHNILEKFNLDSQQNLSDLQDADYAEVISRFNLHQNALQASQQAYVKVQGLSLFNYL